MNVLLGKRTLGLTALVAGVLVMSSASAWYGYPWYRPLGSGAMTYERQTMMRKHGYGMQDLSAMFSGRRTFDREEATRLALELQNGFGPKLDRNYAPGAVVAGSRTTPWAWHNHGGFRAYSEAARQSAGRLAAALSEEPSPEQVAQQGAWVPRSMPRRLARPHPLEGLISMEAIREYDRLSATCYSCHVMSRGWRW